MNKMKNGRIILKATLTNESPVGIGSGRDEHSDRDLVTTLYPMDNNCRILPPENITQAAFMKELPFIPATSFMGKIFRQFDEKECPEVKTLWGESELNASFIDCSDILLTELPEYAKKNSCNPTEIRDGIRIDSSKGTVANGAKFDYEVLGPGAKFDLTMIFRVEEHYDNYDIALKTASGISTIIANGFDLGAKSTVGFGRMKGDAGLFELDFSNTSHVNQWIANELTKNPKTPVTSAPTTKNQFEITASFYIKNSLIIRSYSDDPNDPDSTHLKSGGKNILSGSSIKGALRGRAERILNTIQPELEKTETIIAALFGDVEKEEDDKQKVKKNGYTVTSRVFVDEIVIEQETIKEELQTRIQIDRFTGGTVDGALIEEMPLFPIKNPEKDLVQIKSFRIRVNDAQPTDKGLMLLLLKDLWTADLPIGGEKSVGRGVLKGKSATVSDNGKEFKFPDAFDKSVEMEALQIYVDALNNLNNYSYYQNHVERFKNKKNDTRKQ